MTAFAAPTSEEALSSALRDAAAQKTPLRIRAGGTRSAIGKPVEGAQTLDLSGLSGITRYEPGSLTLEARAGTPMAEIEAALLAENQMLAFEPIDHRAVLGTAGTPTIGGVVAGNVSGPRRFRAGACRDFLLGVRFVDGTGRILKNGGRTMKNVTGLDLTKLMAGAYGTLGVLTEVAFKVLPRPETALTLRLEEPDPAAAVALFSRALGTPFEISGAAWQDDAALLRIEGFAVQVAHRLAELKNLFGDRDPETIEGGEHDEIWTGIRDIAAFAGTPETLWKLAVKGTDAPAIIRAAGDRLGARALLDQGGATVWLAVPSDDPGQAASVRALIPAGAGYATLMRGTKALRRSVPVFQPQHPRIEAVAQGLRQKFDPQAILNPGLMAS